MTISIGRKPGISLRDSGVKYVLNKIQNFSGCLSNASAKKTAEDSAENFAYWVGNSLAIAFGFLTVEITRST